jgi:NAD(P)-dependent dehydrogenase (short-subunit alcohol dehydrogenase family)
MENDLTGRVALVAGGTRGAGRGIAFELGIAGATVIVTGRTTATQQSPMERPETIEGTVELIEAAGGHAVAHRVDHSQLDEVEGLAESVKRSYGRLDVLVNDIWGGDPLTEWDKPFWQQSLEQGLALLRQATETHLITSWALAPLMVETGDGLVVEMTDGVSARYRGSLFYDVAKATVIRLALAQAEELRPSGVAAVAISPGFLRSEAVLEHFGVSEENWRDAITADPHFAQSETPRYVGRAVTHLAADAQRMELSGRATASWELVDRYGFTDVDGSRPHWGTYARDELGMDP